MAKKDIKERTGSGIMKPAKQSVKKATAQSSSRGHTSRVKSRINRGHGRSLGDHPNLVPFNAK